MKPFDEDFANQEASHPGKGDGTSLSELLNSKTTPGFLPGGFLLWRVVGSVCEEMPVLAEGTEFEEVQLQACEQVRFG